MINFISEGRDAARCIACLIATACLPLVSLAGVTVTLVPTQDAFVREQAPTLNYGAAGALAVSGDQSTNASAQMNGRFDTVIQFDASSAVAAFNTAFGPGEWKIRSVQLQVTEVASPNNPIFNRGVGSFQVSWLSDDNWVEGPGSPSFDTVGTGNEMTWNLLQAIVSSATEASLGSFSNTLVSGPLTFDLARPAPFMADLNSGAAVSLHLSPVMATLGFTFNSHNYFFEANRPSLVLTAFSLRADVNCDGTVDQGDVAAFVLALLDPAGFAATYVGCPISKADLNNDSLVDGRDIAEFVAFFLIS